MGEREWVRGREDGEARVGRVSDLTGQQKETAAEMVLARSGMQVDKRTGRVIGKNSAIRGRSMV